MIIVGLMLSLMPLTVTTTAAAPAGNRMSVQIGKLEPDLRKAIQEQFEIDPSGKMRVVIVLDEMAGKAEALGMLESLGATINAQHNIINAISASLPAQNIATLTGLSDVQKILVDEKKYVIPVPDSDDSNIAIENYIENYPYWYSQFPWWIEADKVWEEGITGDGVVAAVLDTGIFYEHPDLEDVVIDYKVFTPEEDVFPHDGYGHGTACASCIAGQAIIDWDLGVPDVYFKVKGVAPGTKILGAKCFLDIGYGWDSWIIEGIEWAVESGADIISGSFGGLEIPNDGNDPTSLAMEAAIDRGVTCFIAAANSAGQSTVTSPGCSPGVITVGASTENSFIYWWLGYWPTAYADGYENDQIIYWSSEGPTADGRTDPDVCAIGAWGLTLDTYPYYLWFQFGGTSMATPVAAGVGALVIEAYRASHGGVSPTPEQVKSILMGTAKDLGYPANKQGAGRVDAYQAYLAAISTRSYPDKPSIDTGIVHPRDSYYKTIEFTEPIDSVATAKFETIDTLEIEGLSGEVEENVFAYFTAPAGTEYVEVRLKFDPEVCFGPVQEYDGSQWTDAHINPTLYRIEDEDWIMLNYAYAHTNTQWFTARATPGDYVLRSWITVSYAGLPPPPTPITFDVQVTFMRQASWDWISTSKVGNKLFTKISVPLGASPGPHSGFIKVMSGGNPVTIPVTVNVPAKLGQTFTTVVDVAYEPRDGIAGDWMFFTVDVDFPCWCLGDITLTVSWTEPNTDFDVFLIAPDGEVEALSLAPSAPVGLLGGGGVVYYTDTGKTMEVLSASLVRGGYWTIGIHNTFLGNVFSETVTIQLMRGKPMTSPYIIYMGRDKTESFKVTNKIDGYLPVDTMVLSFETETFYAEDPGTVPSYPGFIEVPIVVTPDILVLKVSLDWLGDEVLELHLWDPVSLRGLATTKGEEIVVCDPTVGVWWAVITLKTFGEPPHDTDYTLCVGGIRFTTFADVTLDPASFTLDPLGKQTIEITTGPKAYGYGFIVFYNLDTGSIYSRTIIIVPRQRCWIWR